MLNRKGQHPGCTRRVLELFGVRAAKHANYCDEWPLSGESDIASVWAR